MALSISQAALVDAVVTGVVQGYKQAGLVGNMLFPRVPHSSRKGQVIEFDRAAFKLYNTRRSPGSNTGRVDIGYLGRPFVMTNESLEGKLPREIQQEAQLNRVNMAQRATNTPMRAITLGLEVEQAGIATDANNYDAAHKVTLSGTDQWNHASSDPIGQFDTYREAIRASIGAYPNVLVLGPRPWTEGLKNHASLVGRLRDNDTRVTTPQLVGDILEIENVYVGNAVYATAETGDFTDVWGNYAVLAYVPQGSQNMEEPSYGYTYALPGTPYGEPAYEDRNSKSMIYPVTDERVPVLSGMIAGYLVSDCVL